MSLTTSLSSPGGAPSMKDDAMVVVELILAGQLCIRGVQLKWECCKLNWRSTREPCGKLEETV